MLPGVGAKTLRALALVAELVYGATPSYEDPARFGFAHGGKDGIPFPVDRPIYDDTIELWPAPCGAPSSETRRRPTPCVASNARSGRDAHRRSSLTAISKRHAMTLARERARPAARGWARLA